MSHASRPAPRVEGRHTAEGGVILTTRTQMQAGFADTQPAVTSQRAPGSETHIQTEGSSTALSRSRNASILSLEVIRCHFLAPPRAGRLPRQSAETDSLLGRKLAKRPFSMEARAHCGVEWAARQPHTWAFPDLETAANEAGLYTLAEVKALWDRGCFGLGCRARSARSHCLSCARVAGRDWNPKIKQPQDLSKAVKMLQVNCPPDVLGDTILTQVGAAVTYKEKVGDRPSKSLRTGAGPP